MHNNALGKCYFLEPNVNGMLGPGGSRLEDRKAILLCSSVDRKIHFPSGCRNKGSWEIRQAED